MFWKGQSFETVTEFANTLRRLVDDRIFPVEFYQRALKTFFTGVKTVKTELLKRDYDQFSDVVKLGNTLTTSIQTASLNNVTKLSRNAVRHCNIQYFIQFIFRQDSANAPDLSPLSGSIIQLLWVRISEAAGREGELLMLQDNIIFEFL